MFSKRQRWRWIQTSYSQRRFVYVDYRSWRGVNSKRRSRYVLQSRFEVIAERTIRLPRIRKPSRSFFPLKCRGSPSRAGPPVAYSTLPASASLLRHGWNRRLSLARATPGLCRPCRDLSLSLLRVVLRDDSARNGNNIWNRVPGEAATSTSSSSP